MKNIFEIWFKRPKLSEMAKLYLIASDYCSNISKEDSLSTKNFDINQLRDLSFKINFDTN